MADWEGLSIPRLPWETVRSTVDKMWIPKTSPHHSIVGQTGAGKSYFVANGILPLVEHDRVLIIDVKGDDPTLKDIGKKVREIPAAWKSRLKWEDKPRDEWYRLVCYDDWNKAKKQVGQALQRVYKEGNWIVVLDETRFLTDPRIPSLGLRPEVEQLWLRGRSREVCLIAGTQSPKWVPSSFYDQPSFVWIGRLNDEDAQKRLREIGGLSKQHLPVITALKKREWLLIADGGDQVAITGITAGGRVVKPSNTR